MRREDVLIRALELEVENQRKRGQKGDERSRLRKKAGKMGFPYQNRILELIRYR